MILLLQSSHGMPILALGQAGKILFDSRDHAEFDGSRDHRAMLEAGLAATQIDLPDITQISTDIGPGGLGVTRTCAAFANALGFAIKRPVGSIAAFDLLGRSVDLDDGKPVVILRKAGRPFVHFGIYQNGKLTHYEHCEQEIATTALQKLDHPHIAGNIPVEGFDAPLGNAGDMTVMLNMVESGPAPDLNNRAIPIVEVLS